MIWAIFVFLYVLQLALEVITFILGIILWCLQTIIDFLSLIVFVLPSPIFVIRHSPWECFEETKRAWGRLWIPILEQKARPFLGTRADLQSQKQKLQRRFDNAAPGTQVYVDTRNQLHLLDTKVFANEAAFELTIRRYTPPEEYEAYCYRYGVTPMRALIKRPSSPGPAPVPASTSAS